MKQLKSIKLSQVSKIFAIFLIWRSSLFIAAFLAPFIIQEFGWRFPYYDTELLSLNLPSWIINFGNFDGVHYLRVARLGYEGSEYSQAFFPLYPSLIYLSALKQYYFHAGFIISNLFLLASLYLFYRLIKIDYSTKTSWLSLILLLVFPTSFYFGSVYSESMFLFFTISSIFLLRNKHYLGAGVYAALASATRLFGVLLIPLFLIEIYISLKNKELNFKSENFIKALFGIFLIPLGLGMYMWFLQAAFRDPLYFLTAQPVFGAERLSQSVVLLPQVLFRYLKMWFSVPVTSLQFLNLNLELFFTLIPLGLVLLGLKKVRFSYLVFTAGCLILPTLTGTLSSMPRYALMSFLLMPFVVEKFDKYLKWIIGIMILLQVLLLGLFLRGYWVA